VSLKSISRMVMSILCVAKNAETVKAIVKQDDGNYIITKSDGTKLKVLANQVRQIIRAND